uniref:M55 family metallopeptidase n=1 Tax=Brachyspira hyodysenteriae TaxID=159 RepID=UPI0015C441CC
MKVFISAATTQWPDTDAGSLTYKDHALQMTKEVKAACEGAIDAGAKEIFVKDAHDSAMNIFQTALP